MKQTCYGYKVKGHSPFIIIAPHAAGDDRKTARIARLLAEKLHGFCVINNRYKKPSNSKAHLFPKRIEDFNKLYWNSKLKSYRWKMKKPQMRKFYRDIEKFSNKARKFSKNEKVMCVYIHGMNSDSVGIDIGAGVKYKKEDYDYIDSSKTKESKTSSGVPTLSPIQIYTLQKELEKKLQKFFPFTVSIGKIFSGWSRQSAIQFHKHEGRDDYAVQFEINHILRNNEINRRQTIKILEETLRKLYKDNIQ